VQEAARKEAAAVVEEARLKGDEAYRGVMEQAELEAQKAYEQHLKAVEQECSDMRAQAQKNKEKAVKLIIGKVVGASGNC